MASRNAHDLLSTLARGLHVRDASQQHCIEIEAASWSSSVRFYHDGPLPGQLRTTLRRMVAQQGEPVTIYLKTLKPGDASWMLYESLATHPDCPHCEFPVTGCRCESAPTLRNPCEQCGQAEGCTIIDGLYDEYVLCRDCHRIYREQKLERQLAERGE